MTIARLKLCLAIWLMGMAASSALADVKPVYTNKSRFRIPYRYDATEMRQLGARKIHLYLSEDRGRRWELSQTVPPATGRFEFQAPAEGEYWFAVRTLDGNNELYPRGNTLNAGLKVVVDVTPPRFELDVRELRAGEVQLTWRTADENLDASTLRLEYMQTGAVRWEPVNVLSAANGQTTWAFPEGGIVSVRGVISDLAGNQQSTQAQTRITRTIGRQRQPRRELDGPVAMNDGPNLTPGLPPTPSQPGFSPGGLQGNLVSSSQQNRPDILSSPYTSPNVPTQKPPKISKQTRVVRTRSFNIAYKLDDVGSSGVSEVELFITENDGAKWYRYGKDQDQQSPFNVQVPRDGVFGFDLRVRSGAGLAPAPPRPGDKPSVVVVVDQTPPAIRLLGAQQGQGQNYNRVQIRWQVQDDYPSEKPVALSYATDPNGIWEPISGWISDTGTFTWTVPPNMPSRLYLRASARDAAGNMSQTVADQPLLIDLSRPSARIVDVESSRDSRP